MAVTVALLTFAGCSGGRIVVRQAGIGDPSLYDLASLGGVEVTFTDCSGKAFTTTASGNGTFSFNPFSPTSAAIDSSKMITTGPVLVKLQPQYFFHAPIYLTFDHEYGSTCSVAYNNAQHSEPCSLDLLVYLDEVTTKGGSPLPATVDGATVRTNAKGLNQQLSNQQVLDAFNASCAAPH